MNKVISILLLLTLLCGGLYVTLRLRPEWTPDWSFAVFSPSAKSESNPLQDNYLSLQDSLANLDLVIRNEADPRALIAHKERQKYFWAQLQRVRSQMEVQTTPSADDEMQELMSLLTKVLIATVGVLSLIILSLYLLLRRKRRVLTRKLEALKKDPRFREPAGGFGNTVPQGAQTPPTPAERELHRRHEAAITQALAALDPTMATPRVQGRPAKERVTRALQGLAEALSALKAPVADPTATERSKSPKARAKSQNVMHPTQAMDITELNESESILPEPPEALQPSRFDKEREEKADIVRLARRGYTSSEIARRLRLPQDQVELVIRLQREAGE